MKQLRLHGLYCTSQLLRVPACAPGIAVGACGGAALAAAAALLVLQRRRRRQQQKAQESGADEASPMCTWINLQHAWRLLAAAFCWLLPHTCMRSERTRAQQPTAHHVPAVQGASGKDASGNGAASKASKGSLEGSPNGSASRSSSCLHDSAQGSGAVSAAGQAAPAAGGVWQEGLRAYLCEPQPQQQPQPQRPAAPWRSTSKVPRSQRSSVEHQLGQSGGSGRSGSAGGSGSGSLSKARAEAAGGLASALARAASAPGAADRSGSDASTALLGTLSLTLGGSAQNMQLVGSPSWDGLDPLLALRGGGWGSGPASDSPHSPPNAAALLSRLPRAHWQVGHELAQRMWPPVSCAV